MIWYSKQRGQPSWTSPLRHERIKSQCVNISHLFHYDTNVVMCVLLRTWRPLHVAYDVLWFACAYLVCMSWRKTKVVLVKVVSWIIDYVMNNQLCLYTPLIALHKYRTVYENNRLFRKPPLLGPPLSLPECLTCICYSSRSWLYLMSFAGWTARWLVILRLITCEIHYAIHTDVQGEKGKRDRNREGPLMTLAVHSRRPATPIV